METNVSQKIYEYAHLFLNMQFIQEIDHIEDQFFGFIVESVPDYDFSGIAVIENRMAISFGVFDILYPVCKKIVLNTQNLSEEEFKQRLEEINLASRIVLCLNGEINSAVNRRIRMLELNLLQDLEEELHFVKLVSLKFKKSGVVWYYRQRLIAKLLEGKGVSEEKVEKSIAHEDVMLDEFFKKYPRNYYAWGYKKFLIDEFIIKRGYENLLRKEYFKVREYCEKHVHDFCAFHLLGVLVSKLVKKEKHIQEEEVIWAKNLIKKYQELYILESLEVENKGVNYSELESAKRFLNIIQKF